jgi:hypothetical protein
VTVEAAGYFVICAVVGIVLVLYSVYQRSKLRASAIWQPVTGTITKAEVETVQSSDSTEYSLNLVYDYTTNGKSYAGKQVRFGRKGYVRKKKAQAELEKYPLNSNVVVYVNPDKPEECVLVREAPYATFNMVLGIALTVFAIVVGMWAASRS